MKKNSLVLLSTGCALLGTSLAACSPSASDGTQQNNQAQGGSGQGGLSYGSGGSGSGATTGSGSSSSTGGQSATSGGSTGNGTGGSLSTAPGYDANLAKILASTFRNTKEDTSPYLLTPSADLYDKADLYGPVSAYKEGRGYYGGPEWFENEYYPGNGAATFRASCEVSHFAYDDPALFPGQPEASHLVMFLGNTHTNAYTTPSTLLNSGGSTCNGGELNRSAYWVPAMFDGKGNVVVPSKTKFYYKTEAAAGVGKTEIFPPNLTIIADRSNNQNGNLDTSTFRCNDVYNGGKSNPSNTIPTCYGPSQKSGYPGSLEMLIFFNYCWNGDEATAGDWWQNRLGNLVPPEIHWFSSQCPASHPHLLPAIATHIFFDVAPGEDTSGWHLSSDVDPNTGALLGARGNTATAGWMGGWNKQINKEFIDNCNNVMGAECAAGMLADRDDARALRLRHDWITGPHRIPLSDIYQQLCTANGDRPFDAKDGAKMAAYCRPMTPAHAP